MDNVWLYHAHYLRVRGRVIRAVDLESLVPPGTLDSVMRGRYPASLRTVGGST